MEGLDLDHGEFLGEVVRLEANRLTIAIRQRELVRHVTVSDLVAIPNGAATFVVALVDSITAQGEPEEQGPLEAVVLGHGALVNVMPLGTLHLEDASRPRFIRGAAPYPRLGHPCHLIAGDRLRSFLALLGGHVSAGAGLTLGRYVADHGSPAIADANRLFQRHLAVLGSTGAGKSWAVSLLLERVSHSPNANMIVFDLHGEYGALAKWQGGVPPIARRLRVAGPGDHAGEADDDLLYLPYWLFERDELLRLALNPEDPHATDQEFRFTEHVLTLKRISLIDAGRHAAAKTFTIDSPVPYRLDHLLHMLRADDTEKVVRHPTNQVEPGPYTGRLTGFVTRLEARVADPRYGFIFRPPSSTLRYDWFKGMSRKLLATGHGNPGIKVIDVSEVPSAIVPMVVGILTRLVYEFQFWMDPARRSPICVVCDEAHLYVPSAEDSTAAHEPALRAFEAIAKEGRKYGVSLVVVSQRPTDVSRTILSQCNNFIVMRVTSDHDRGVIERMLPDSFAGVTRLLPVLDVGEALMIGDALPLPTRFLFDAPAIQPTSSTQPYWTLWAQRPSDDRAIAESAEALRNQFRTRTPASSAVPIPDVGVGQNPDPGLLI